MLLAPSSLNKCQSGITGRTRDRMASTNSTRSLAQSCTRGIVGVEASGVFGQPADCASRMESSAMKNNSCPACDNTACVQTARELLVAPPALVITCSYQPYNNSC